MARTGPLLFGTIPPPGLAWDRSHPLTRGLRFATLMGHTRPVNLAGPGLSRFAPADAPLAVGSMARGPARRFPGTGGMIFDHSDGVSTFGNMSMVARRYSALPAYDTILAFKELISPGWDATERVATDFLGQGFAFAASNAPGNHFVMAYTGSGGGQFLDLVVGGRYRAVSSLRASSAYLGGDLISSTGTSANDHNQYQSYSRVAVGGATGDNGATWSSTFVGRVAVILVYGWAIPDAMQKLLATQPWTFLRPAPVLADFAAFDLSVHYESSTNAGATEASTFPMTVETDVQLSAFLGGDLDVPAPATGDAHYTTMSGNISAKVMDVPEVILYESKTTGGAAYTVVPRADYRTVVGTRDAVRPLTDGRRDLLAQNLYRR